MTEQAQPDAETVKALARELGYELHPWQQRLVDLLFDPERGEIVISHLSGRYQLPREYAHPRLLNGRHGAGGVYRAGDGVGAVDVADSAAAGEPPAVPGG